MVHCIRSSCLCLRCEGWPVGQSRPSCQDLLQVSRSARLTTVSLLCLPYTWYLHWPDDTWNPGRASKLLLTLHNSIWGCLEEVTPRAWSLNSFPKCHNQISSTVNTLPIFTFIFIFLNLSLAYLIMSLKENCSVTFVGIFCKLRDQDCKTSETSITRGNICLYLPYFLHFYNLVFFFPH